MKNFWNSLLTEKSWNILQELSKKPLKFIVIGGWATYLWTNLHKSKDIDIALEDIKQIDYLKHNYYLKKNDSLKKYEITQDEIDIDIYVPYFSELAIPIEDLKQFSTKKEGFTLPKPEALIILKQQAEINRKESVKGEKDRIDILALLFFSTPDFREYFKLIEKYNLNNYHERLKEIIITFKDNDYLNLNPRELKIKKKEILEKLKKS